MDLDPKIRDVYGFPVPASRTRPTASRPRRPPTTAPSWRPSARRRRARSRASTCRSAPWPTAAARRPAWRPGQAATAHIMGTARMGNDPRRSVADRFGRLHGVENLHVADGSVFVTAGGFNPTLTIMALSLRMATAPPGAGARKRSPAAGAATTPPRHRHAGRDFTGFGSEAPLRRPGRPRPSHTPRSCAPSVSRLAITVSARAPAGCRT